VRSQPLTDEQYHQLLALRTGLRRFLRWSDGQAEDAGVTPTQHQLLLAVRGHPGPGGPTIGDIANHLLLRHHSAVGLVDRAEQAGLVRKRRDDGDQRIVRVSLSARGERILTSLAADHLEELARLAHTIRRMSGGLDRSAD
jgi:DNA-binding MarR family transcriptional regulator